jgi:hypothetical protein
MPLGFLVAICREVNMVAGSSGGEEMEFMMGEVLVHDLR